MEALINFTDAIWRNALICSAAERAIGTMYCDACARDIRNLCAFRQHYLISVPVQPSSLGSSPDTPYFFR